jgi:regulator of replication initiation timing
MNSENVTKEELLNLEKKLKELYDQKANLLKDKTSLFTTNEFLRNEIAHKQKLITSYNVKIAQKDKPKDENNVIFSLSSLVLV